MTKFYFSLIILISIGFTKPIYSFNISIVANVNDEIITNVDLNNRLNLAMIMSKLPNEKEIKKRLRGQILKVLIEEKLKVQEANKFGIHVSNEEIIAEINILESKLNLEPNSMIDNYRNRDVPEITIFNQIRSQLLWRKLLYSTVVKNFKIPENQLEEALETYIKTSGDMEYNFSEIFISFVTSDEESARKRIQSIMSRATTENFSLLAQQFSDGAVIYENNNTNWTRESMLDDKTKEALSKLDINIISEPVKGRTGYHIYLINDKRKTKKITKNQTLYDLSQIYFSIGGENRKKKITYYKNLLSTMKTAVYGCEDLEKTIEETSEAVGGKIGIVNKNSIELDFIRVLEGIKVGELSEAAISKNGIHALMLCSPIIENSLEKLKQSLEGKIRYIKINNSSENYLNRIRKKALIEIKSLNME